MGRQEIHSDKVSIDQKAPLVGDAELATRNEGNVVEVDADVANHDDYLDALKFGEEPMTIRLEPSAEKNAATSFPIWVNGKGAEVLINGKWLELTYLPVGQILITKRKYVAVLAAAKIDSVSTEIKDADSERPDNRVVRVTSALHSFSILEDKNPRGAAWLAELRRRNF